MRGRKAAAFLSALAVGLALGGCGGGDDQGVGETAEPAGVATSPPDTGSGGTVTAGDPTLTTEPGSASAEVEGSTLVYESAGSLYYVCDIAADRIQVNFQTNEGRDLLLTAALVEDRWLGRLTFQPGKAERLQYSATLPDDADPLIIGEAALSFEGTVSRIQDADVAGAETVAASLAVNCAGSGEQPNAVLAGTEYTFSPSGAQSFDCAVTDDALDVRVNRLSADGLQLEVSARQDGDQWIGAVVVTTPEGTFTSTLPPEGTGLTVDGSSVDYEGTFTGGPSGDVTGTVSLTCP